MQGGGPARLIAGQALGPAEAAFGVSMMIAVRRNCGTCVARPTRGPPGASIRSWGSPTDGNDQANELANGAFAPWTQAEHARASSHRPTPLAPAPCRVGLVARSWATAEPTKGRERRQ